MRLIDAVTELQCSKDWTPTTARWYTSRLNLFLIWAEAQGVTTIDAVTPSLVRRYVAHLQSRPARNGARLDTHTVHGHVRIIRRLLF